MAIKVLLVIDRQDGSTTRISESDERYGYSIHNACKANGITYDKALKILNAGQELITAGFIRKHAVTNPTN